MPGCTSTARGPGGFRGGRDMGISDYKIVDSSSPGRTSGVRIPQICGIAGGLGHSGLDFPVDAPAGPCDGGWMTKIRAVNCVVRDPNTGNILGLGIQARLWPQTRHFDRAFIVQMLSGQTPPWQLWTVLPDKNGRMTLGAQVHVYRGHFLRTDPNPIEEDNLEEVEDCQNFVHFDDIDDEP